MTDEVEVIVRGKEVKPREGVSIRAKGNTTKNKPMFDCSNCGCIRYNECGCQKKG